jgi:cadmium resistance protein CadD (predicted permease)
MTHLKHLPFLGVEAFLSFLPSFLYSAIILLLLLLLIPWLLGIPKIASTKRLKTHKTKQTNLKRKKKKKKTTTTTTTTEKKGEEEEGRKEEKKSLVV